MYLYFILMFRRIPDGYIIVDIITSWSTNVRNAGGSASIMVLLIQLKIIISYANSLFLGPWPFKSGVEKTFTRL